VFHNIWDDFPTGDGDGAAAWGGWGQRLGRAYNFDVEIPAKEEEYEPSYTHPQPPEPSFTHSWGESDEDEIVKKKKQSRIVIEIDDADDTDGFAVLSSTKEVPPPPPMKVVLVCARCMAPLIMGADGAEQPAEKRVWGLRCGHMIDGACMEALSMPLPVLGEESTGKKGKGKGKAKAPPPYATQTPPILTETNPIRSRLRSKARNPDASSDTAGPSTSTSTSGASSSAAGPSTSNNTSQSYFSAFNSLLPGLPTFFSGRGSATSTARGGSGKGRKKGSGRRQAKPKIQAEHRWACPVNGCFREHTSICIDGVWGPERERGEGPIALFV
jgi:hypothetical protein